MRKEGRTIGKNVTIISIRKGRGELKGRNEGISMQRINIT